MSIDESEIPTPSAERIAAAVGLPVPLCEMILQHALLVGTCDPRFPEKDVERYVRGRYGLTEKQFQKDFASFVIASAGASAAWADSAGLEVRGLFEFRSLVLTEPPAVTFETLQQAAYVSLEVRDLDSRDLLLRTAASLRDSLALLALPSANRNVPAARLVAEVLHHVPRIKAPINAIRVELAGSTAIRLLPQAPEAWLRESKASVGVIHNDLLVRALKTKLVAIGIANRFLDAVNRRLRSR